MMLYKPIISLIVAFSAASGAAASATPLRRGGSGAYPPPPAQPVSNCVTNGPQCCNTYTSASNPAASTLAGLLDLVLNPAAGIGLSCLPILSGISCNANTVCCTNVIQQGLINLGCSPLNLL